jgi:hypothetical protein
MWHTQQEREREAGSLYNNKTVFLLPTLLSKAFSMARPLAGDCANGSQPSSAAELQTRRLVLPLRTAQG